MNKLLFFAIFLLASCSSNTPTQIEGKVSNPTFQNGKVSFNMNGQTYIVNCLPSDYSVMGDTTKNITIMFNREKTEIVQIYSPKKFAALKIWCGVIAAILFAIIIATNTTPTETRYNANRGSNWQDQIRY